MVLDAAACVAARARARTCAMKARRARIPRSAFTPKCVRVTSPSGGGSIATRSERAQEGAEARALPERALEGRLERCGHRARAVAVSEVVGVVLAVERPEGTQPCAVVVLERYLRGGGAPAGGLDRGAWLKAPRGG